MISEGVTEGMNRNVKLSYICMHLRSAHLPAIFAAELKNRLNRGQCNDDALIVLAVNDSSVIF